MSSYHLNEPRTIEVEFRDAKADIDPHEANEVILQSGVTHPNDPSGQLGVIRDWLTERFPDIGVIPDGTMRQFCEFVAQAVQADIGELKKKAESIVPSLLSILESPAISPDGQSD